MVHIEVSSGIAFYCTRYRYEGVASVTCRLIGIVHGAY